MALSVLGLSLVQSASAEVYKINPANPSNFGEVKSEVQKIKDDLASAMCGGWDTEIEVKGVFQTPSPEGKIAKVANVPGRTGDPLGNITSGMALRNEQGGIDGKGFEFPTQTAGLQTLCRPATEEYLDPQRPYRVNASFFCEHPCQRPLGDIKPQNSDSGYASCGNQTPDEDGIKYSCGGGEMKAPGQQIDQEVLQHGKEGGLCEDLNDWVYSLHQLYLWSCEVQTPVGPISIPIYAYKKGACDRQDLVNTGSEPGPEGFGDWQFVGKYECCSDSPYDTNKDNCIPCQGEICRYNPQAKEVILNDIWVEPFPNDIPGCSPVSEDFRKQIANRNYKSFYREYAYGTFERDQVDQYVPQDSAKREEIPVACYGIYETVKPAPPDGAPKSQEDAKIRMIENKEKRCVIAAYYDQKNANFWNMKDTQKGKGHYGETSNIPDDPFNDGPRDSNFDENTDMWYQNIGAGFSLLNDKLYTDQFQDDLTFALLSPDTARMRASGQTANADGQLLSSGALLRAFDDTVTNDDGAIRTIVEWWQDLENEMHKRLSPPIIRLLLPAAWSIDLDPLDPLYTPDIPDPNEPPEKVDPKLQPIEVQLHAGEDTIGDVVAFMQRSVVLRVEEKPIQIMVPLGSSTELRSLAYGWENWKKVEEERGHSVDPKVTALIAKLHEYADYSDQVRQLRGELPRYVGELLSKQKEMTDALAQWLVNNVNKYQEYLDNREELNQLRGLWESTQDEYRKFHEKETLPWCRNERFTTPIYSLLDPWLFGRDKDGDVRGNKEFGDCTRNGTDIFACADQHGPGLPFLEEYLEPNLEMDFTAFSSASGTVILPILKPVQIRMSISQLQPPSLLSSGDQENIPELPNLPPIPTIYQDVQDSYPDVHVVDPPPILTPPELDSTNVSLVLQLSRYILEEMTKEYKLFWDAATDHPKPGTEQDCLDPHSGNCVHAEMDLKERFQRLAARPAIFLKEDFQSIGERLNRLVTPYTECPTDDWVCHILHATERKPREGWQTQITNPDDYEEQFDELLDRVRRQSDNINNLGNSSSALPIDLRQDSTFPSFRNPPDIDLAPDPTSTNP